jgi:hypothetical protein
MKMISIALFALVPALYAAEPAKPPATVWCIQPVWETAGRSPKVWKEKEGAKFSTPSCLDLRSMDRLRQAVVGDVVRYVDKDGKPQTETKVLNAFILDRIISGQSGNLVKGRFVALYLDTTVLDTKGGLRLMGVSDDQGRKYNNSGAAPKEIQAQYPNVGSGGTDLGTYRNLLVFFVFPGAKGLTATFEVGTVSNASNGRPLKTPVEYVLNIRLDLDKAEPVVLKSTPQATESAPVPRKLTGAPAK